MSRVRTLLSCSECGQPASQWAGRCPGCGAWGTIAERPAERGRSPGRASGPGGGRPAVSTLAATVSSSVVLLAGEPGIGKSTLLLHVMANLSVAGFTCLLASGEESRAQVSVRVRRLGLDGQRLSFTSGRELPEVLDAAVAEHPFLLAVDSIQTLRDPASASMPGGPSQVRGCADALVGLAKQEGIAVLVTGHVTKDGDLAGPRTLEHAVDVVLSFEGDSRSGLRVLAGGKNRFGPEGEVAWFEMGTSGLVATEPGPRIGVGGGEAGCATALTLAGRRAFAVDVQALV